MKVFEKDYSKYISLFGWKRRLNAFSSKDIHFLDSFLDLEAYPVEMDR